MVAHESSSPRKDSQRQLNALRMSDGFRAAAKSRATIPEALLSSASDRDDEDDDANDEEEVDSIIESPSRRAGLRRSAGGGSQSQGSPLKRGVSSTALAGPSNGPETTTRPRRTVQSVGGSSQNMLATPTKPKPSQGPIFLADNDPRLRSKTTPRTTRRKTNVDTPKSRSRGDDVARESRTKDKGKGKQKEEETPTRPRTRHENLNGTVNGTRKRKHGRDSSTGTEAPDDELNPPRASGSRSRAAQSQRRATTRRADTEDNQDSEDAEDGGRVGLEPGDPEEEEGVEEGGTSGNEEDRSSSAEEEEISSPTKRTSSKKKNDTHQSVLEVPGFITQTSFDVYFQQISIPARTSGRAFTSLLPTLSSQEYWEHLDASSATAKHVEELHRLRETHVKHFPRYLMELQAGFNLLFYGFGSKRDTLNQFARECCAKRGNVVVLNGYRPGIGIKELLGQIDSLRGDAPGTEQSGPPTLSAIEAQAHRIYHRYHLPSTSTSSNSPTASRPLFVIIHNIDSVGLRAPKAKSILALLASNPRIHLVGSVDHMNAPLIWKQSQATGRTHHAPPSEASHSTSDVPSVPAFTWLWHDLTTFEHYDVELRASGQDLTSLTVTGSGKPKVGGGFAAALAGGGPAGAAGPLTEAGAHQVLSSVTERSRKIFVLLANRQLADIDAEGVVVVDANDSPSKKANVTAAQMNRHAQSYESLFSAARESFIATSDQALRGLLQEFKDHGMVMMGASNTGGGEVIWIPLARNVLEKLVDTPGDD